MDGGPTHGEPVLGLELLGEMRGVEPRVPASGQGEDLLLHGGRQAAPRRAAPIAMYEGLAPIRSEARQQPPHVALRQAQTPGRLGPGEAVLEDQPQGVVSVKITLTHGHQSRGGGHGVSLRKWESLPLPSRTLRKSLNS